MMTTAESLVLLIVLALAVRIDVAARRIPNLVVLAGTAAGVVMAALGGWSEFALALAGFGTGLLLFLPAYLWASMGAGDVKLVATVGVFLGPKGVLFAALASVICGGVLGLVVLLARRGGKSLLRRYAQMLRTVLATGHCAYIPPQETEAAAARIPYAVAIASGTLAVLWHTGSLGQLAATAEGLIR